LEERIIFRFIAKNISENNTSTQKVDVFERAALHSTVEFFTDLGHLRIIVDNTMGLIWLWMWQIYCTKQMRNIFIFIHLSIQLIIRISTVRIRCCCYWL